MRLNERSLPEPNEGWNLFLKMKFLKNACLLVYLTPEDSIYQNATPEEQRENAVEK
jgi:hypothetical protein